MYEKFVQIKNKFDGHVYEIISAKISPTNTLAVHYRNKDSRYDNLVTVGLTAEIRKALNDEKSIVIKIEDDSFLYSIELGSD